MSAPPVITQLLPMPARPDRHRTTEIVIHKFRVPTKLVPPPWRDAYPSPNSVEALEFFFREVPEGVATVALGGTYANKVPIFKGWERVGAVPDNVKSAAFVPYHFVVDDNGLVYQALPLMAKGAHAAGVNMKSIGVVIMGDHDKKRPPVHQLISAARLVSWLRSPDVLPAIGAASPPEIISHDFVLRRRHQHPKGCPGRYLPMADFRSLVEEVETC